MDLREILAEISYAKECIAYSKKRAEWEIYLAECEEADAIAAATKDAECDFTWDQVVAHNQSNALEFEYAGASAMAEKQGNNGCANPDCDCVGSPECDSDVLFDLPAMSKGGVASDCGENGWEGF